MPFPLCEWKRKCFSVALPSQPCAALSSQTRGCWKENNYSGSRRLQLLWVQAVVCRGCASARGVGLAVGGTYTAQAQLWHARTHVSYNHGCSCGTHDRDSMLSCVCTSILKQPCKTNLPVDLIWVELFSQAQGISYTDIMIDLSEVYLAFKYANNMRICEAMREHGLFPCPCLLHVAHPAAHACPWLALIMHPCMPHLRSCGPMSCTHRGARSCAPISCAHLGAHACLQP
eukprot:352365-Chlamydomonas_euryale.AAC.4